MSLLRAAADRSGCEAVLALADIQETWSAYESEPGYGYRDWDDDDEDEDEYRDDEGAFAAGQDRPEWLASLPGLCEALHAKGSPGTATAHRLRDLSWDWLGKTIRQWLATQSPSHRDKRLGDLGQPLAAVLTAAAVTGAVSLRDEVAGFGRQQGDEVIACVMPALRAAGTLRTFLADPARHTFEWPLNQERRRHVHSQIDAAELPVRHETRRKGRPYTLVLTKSQALFELERQARIRNEADLEWLTGEWKLT